ncbi:DUF969 domain-containing protein [Lacticaseibacillus absianus]|uniref:DUF969 domain-containing protein n=1 Tax=Lacticaseibacillus absianus TaxID=2729623 RepID=UPI0015C98A09|nr:DUF969 domain-containing protein [Lacticaseibacillus absianus]
MEYLKLIGILIIVIGFALKWDTTAVVVIAAIATGLFSGMSIPTLLATLGESFVTNRPVSLFFLTLPMIGLVERHGLKEVAVNAIKKLKRLTPSRILNLYLAIRELGGIFGISLSGQVQFVRPLITPMVTAAAEAKRPLTDPEIDLIKGRAAAVDNFGNFFAQNLFVASGGVLLISQTMTTLKHPVTPNQVVMNSIPVALVTLVIVVAYNVWFDRRFNAKEAR